MLGGQCYRRRLLAYLGGDYGGKELENTIYQATASPSLLQFYGFKPTGQ